MNRSEKEQEVAFLKDVFTKAKIAVVADYRGLSVAQMTELRGKVRENGAMARVVKNNLARMAASEVYKDAPQEDLDQLTSLFEGPNFITASFEEVVGLAKAVEDFSKKGDAFVIKGAWFDGTFLTDKKVKELSSMPSKEETLAKLLSLINTPATRMVQIMNAPAGQMVQLLGAYRAELEKKAA